MMHSAVVPVLQTGVAGLVRTLERLGVIDPAHQGSPSWALPTLVLTAGTAIERLEDCTGCSRRLG